MDRRTVKRCRKWAQAHGLLEGGLPPLEELRTLAAKTLPEKQLPQNVSSVEPYREVVTQLVKKNVRAAVIYQRLLERGFTGSYSAVYRFVRHLKHPKTGGDRMKPGVPTCF